MMAVTDAVITCSPCTWGLTDGADIEHISSEVFPMHVGINRLLVTFGGNMPRVPHARGD